MQNLIKCAKLTDFVSEYFTDISLVSYLHPLSLSVCLSLSCLSVCLSVCLCLSLLILLECSNVSRPLLLSVSYISVSLLSYSISNASIPPTHRPFSLSLPLSLSACLSLSVCLSVCLCLSLLSALKRFLGVNSKSPRHLIYGETGQTPPLCNHVCQTYKVLAAPDVYG